jgi:hypothetical protein
LKQFEDFVVIWDFNCKQIGLFFLPFSLLFLLYVTRSLFFFRVCCELWSGGIVGFCQGLLWIEMGRRSMFHFFHPKTHSLKLFLCFWWLCFRIRTRHLQFFASTLNGQRSMNCQSTYYTRIWFDPPLDLMFWTFIEDFLWVFWHNVAFVINQIQHQPQSGSISNSLMPAHLLHKSHSLSNSTEAWEEATSAIRQSMQLAISFACFWYHGLFLASSPTNTESFGHCIRTSPDYFLGVSVVISKWHRYRSGGNYRLSQQNVSEQIES